MREGRANPRGEDRFVYPPRHTLPVPAATCNNLRCILNRLNDDAVKLIEQSWMEKWLENTGSPAASKSSLARRSPPHLGPPTPEVDLKKLRMYSELPKKRYCVVLGPTEKQKRVRERRDKRGNLVSGRALAISSI